MIYMGRFLKYTDYKIHENKILVIVFMKVLGSENAGRSGIRGSNVGMVGFQLVVLILKVRAGVKSIKKIKGKAGKPDKIDLIVNVDLVNISQLKQISNFSSRLNSTCRMVSSRTSRKSSYSSTRIRMECWTLEIFVSSSRH